jgi:hypothetical protein
METFKIKIHSSVGLITNSSTVIFTYSEGSISAVRDLINEMLKVFGHEDKSFDDLFYASTFLSDDSVYYESESFPEFEIEDWKERRDKSSEFLNDLKIKILEGKIDRPIWMKKAEEKESGAGYNKSTSLEILPKDKKYSELSNKLLKYLYSTSHEGMRDG